MTETSIQHELSDGDGTNLQQASEGTSAPTRPRTKLQTTLIMFAICMAVFLAAIDTVILTTALPTIAVDLKASDSGFAWIGAAYLVGAAASMPIWGNLSDIFGRKPVIVLANIVFMIGSLLSALSKDLKMLLVGRSIQGVGGGGLILLPYIVVSDIFSIRDRSLYLSLIGATWSFASALGPALGGVFAQDVSWRWCFWLNLPCDGLSLILLTLFLHVHDPRTPILQGLKAIDWLGTLTVTGGTLMFLMGLEFGGVTFPWRSATVVCLLLSGILTFTLFVGIEWKIAKRPLIPLRIFCHRSTAAVFIICASHGFAIITTAYFLPFYFQAVLGASPIHSGVCILIMAGAMAFTTIHAGVYIRKTGRYVGVIRMGTFLMALGFGLYINFQPYRSWPRIVVFQLVVGLGIGALFQSPLIALQTNLLPKDVAMGTTTFGALRLLSGGVGLVIGQVIFQSQMNAKYPSMIKAGIAPALAKMLSQGNTVSATFVIQRLPLAQQAFVKAAIKNSLQRMWIFYTVLSFVAFVASFGIVKSKLSEDHVEVKTGLGPAEPKPLNGDVEMGISLNPIKSRLSEGDVEVEAGEGSRNNSVMPIKLKSMKENV